MATPEPQPNERDRAKVVLDALSRFGPGLTEYDRVTFIMGMIRQARAAGRRGAIEECAGIADGIFAQGERDHINISYGIAAKKIAAAIRALLTESGDA